MDRKKKDNFIGDINLDCVKVKINNLESLNQTISRDFKNKDLEFDKEKYIVSFDGQEYYIRKRCEDDGYKYLKTLSKQDLKTDYKKLYEHLEENYVKEKKPTEVEVFFNSKKVPYNDFELASEGKDVYVQYVNKSR